MPAWEIAEVIADALSGAGRPAHLVRLTDDGADPDPEGYEAVVLGSAVYGAALAGSGGPLGRRPPRRATHRAGLVVQQWPRR